MMKRLLPFTLMVLSCLNGLAQDFTFDGHNCSAGNASEWGMPDYADNDTDGDGYGEQDTPTGTADVLNIWYRSNADFLYLAFERRKTGNSYFSFYLNTDCDSDTGDQANDGTDIAIAFDIRPGSDPMITNNLIYTWNGTEYQTTGQIFEARVGKESCDGDLGLFFELQIPLSAIFETCGGANACHSMSLNLASARAGGSPNSRHKDNFDFPVSIGINSSPTAVIDAPDKECAGTEVMLDGTGSQYFDMTKYNDSNAPDFMDSIVSFEWDIDYNGTEFNTTHSGEQPKVIFDREGNRVIALRITDAFGCTHMITHEIRIKAAPKADFTYTRDTDCGMFIETDASGSKASTRSRCVKYEWDFNYDGSFNVEDTGIRSEYTYDSCGTYTIALRVTDNSSQCNTAMITRTVEIGEDEAPVFTVPDDIEILAGQDHEDLDLTGRVTDADDNCRVDSIDHRDEIATNSCGETVVTRTWTVSDACGNTTEQTQLITVKASTTEYSIEAPEDIEMSCAAEYLPCVDFETLDNNSEIKHAGRTIYISAGSSRGSRQAALFNSASPSSYDPDLGTPNEDFGGSGKGNGGSAGGANQNFIPRNNILIIQQPGYSQPNDLNERGSYVDFDLSEFNGVTLSTISLLDLESGQRNKKVELFDENNSLMASLPIPTTGDNGAVTMDLSNYNGVFRMKVTLDGSGAIASFCFENNAINSGSAIVNSDCNQPPGIWYEDEAVYGDCGLEQIKRTWYTTDLTGNLYSDVQYITVTDHEAPVFNETLPASNLTASCDTVPEAETLTATDACSGDVNVVFEERISGSDQCGYTSEITRTWTATDCSGNSVTHTQVISIEDHEPPVFVSDLPGDITVECSDIPAADTLEAMDNCDVAVSIDLKEEIIQGGCAGESMIVRTWTASDCAGNSVSHTQTITVRDNTGPQLDTVLDLDVTVSCGSIPEVPELEFSDACGSKVDLSFSSVDDFDSSTDDYQIIRTWIATDECGNTTEVTQTIFVMNDSETIALEELLRCIEDTPVNLNSYLPEEVHGTGVWQLANDADATLANGIFDPMEMDLGTYQYEYRGNDGQCGVVYTIAIEVHDDCVVLPCTSAKDVVISKTITPNGDAYNEYFTVKGVSDECGFRIKVQIFNRWGLEVYASNDYQNDWNGFTNNSAIGKSGQVPAGTYYYVVTLVDSGMDPFTGAIYVGTGSN